MPKTVISDAKGVVNSAGSGTTVSNAATFNGSVLFKVQSVAAAGSESSNAGVISATAGATVKGTGADGTKGIRLPTPTEGLHVVVINPSQASVLKLYPHTSGTINGVADAADGNISIPAKGQALCFGDGTYWWVSEPAVAS